MKQGIFCTCEKCQAKSVLETALKLGLHGEMDLPLLAVQAGIIKKSWFKDKERKRINSLLKKP